MRLGLVALLVFGALARPGLAEEAVATPPPPPPALTGSLGAGLAITSGNSSTRNYSVSLELLYDPKTQNIVKFEGLYVRGETEGKTSIDKTSFVLRDEYKVSPKAFAFGDLRYLKDRFKSITYLITPVVGGGYHAVKDDKITLSFDAGFGLSIEKNPGLPERSSGAYRAGEAFSWTISPTATLTEKASGVWKANDTGDAIYHAEIALAASLTTRLQLKIAYQLDHKTRPPTPTTKKTDTTLLAQLVVKL